MHFPLHSMNQKAAGVLPKARLSILLACIVAQATLLAGCGSASSVAAPAGPQITPTATTKPALVFVAIGASETFGTGADYPDRQNWPTDLSAQLPQGTQVINLGIPGVTAHEALQGELPEALDSNPNIVTVWLGTNDIIQNVSLDQYQQDLDAILTKLEALPHIHIAVANLADLTLLPRFRSDDQTALKQQVGQWNAVISQEITAHHAILVDIYGQTDELTSHPEYLSPDGLHPSTQGYQQIANLFYQTLHANGVI